MECMLEYFQEKYNTKVVKDNDGYILYNAYSDGSLYVRQFFIKKEARNKSKSRYYEQLLIEKEKPEIIYCDVDLTANDADHALMIILIGGYKIDKVYNDKIILCREISYE